MKSVLYFIEYIKGKEIQNISMMTHKKQDGKINIHHALTCHHLSILSKICNLNDLNFLPHKITDNKYVINITGLFRGRIDVSLESAQKEFKITAELENESIIATANLFTMINKETSEKKTIEIQQEETLDLAISDFCNRIKLGTSSNVCIDIDKIVKELSIG